uniref:Uncharacterized protein n=1 Tax=Candidatus Kentrum sp. LFY TaxID=2126342 RepID=A0A450WRV9_9GAMM|nr:MAG: hypothetical protein BECKLFY1418C_GA0070996_106220 [Candidatus Kentron sp. LFY]
MNHSCLTGGGHCRFKVCLQFGHNRIFVFPIRKEHHEDSAGHRLEGGGEAS